MIVLYFITSQTKWVFQNAIKLLAMMASPHENFLLGMFSNFLIFSEVYLDQSKQRDDHKTLRLCPGEQVASAYLALNGKHNYTFLNTQNGNITFFLLATDLSIKVNELLQRYLGGSVG